MTVATDLGVPRSTARGWLGAAPAVVVCLDGADLTEPELRQEVLKLRRRVQKLTALLRLALALLRTSGFRLTGARLPDGRAKIQILRAVDRAREYLPLRAVLRFLRVSPSRFHVWRRQQTACALDDQSSCPRTSPFRLTPTEVRAIQDMVTSPDYRHVPTGTLAVLAQRLGTVWASPSTWYRLVRQHGWRRPRFRVRFYTTVPYQSLDAGLREFGAKLMADEQLQPTTRCLTLLATRGERPAWNSRATSMRTPDDPAAESPDRRTDSHGVAADRAARARRGRRGDA